MISKLNKSKILNFFTYFGFLFIIISILIYAGWAYLLNAIDEVKNYEKISIFSETYSKDNTLEDDLLQYLKTNDQTNLIYEVNLYQFAKNDNNITSYYDKFGSSSDLLILNENDLVDMDKYIENNFLSITDSLLNKIFQKSNISNYDFYEYDNKKYAIKLFDKNNSSYTFLDNYFSYYQDNDEEKDNYYLLINKNSVNLGEFDQSSKTNNAILALQYLFTEGESNEK